MCPKEETLREMQYRHGIVLTWTDLELEIEMLGPAQRAEPLFQAALVSDSLQLTQLEWLCLCVHLSFVSFAESTSIELGLPAIDRFPRRPM